jgi:hypothetical protein
MRGASVEAIEKTSTGVDADRADQPDSDLRRFKRAAAAGLVAGFIPFAWALLDLWNGSLNLFRAPPRAVGSTTLYDLQAQAILHGHLWIQPPGALGIEGFGHDGHYYTYFGLLPSLLRIPIVLLAPSLKGHVTAPSMLLAWVLIAIFSSMLLWRLRVMIRPTASLSRSEAASYSVLLATVTGGSVLVFLASTPWVYTEDLIWSVALTIGSLFALLGVLQQPSRWRIVTAGVLILLVNLNRQTTGWACIVGAFLVAAWFGLGRSGNSARRRSIPIVIIGIIPLVVSCAINLIKFGVLFGIPLQSQVWTSLNVHRRLMLAANGGNYENISFLPTTLWSYFGPGRLRFETVFPFVTLPSGYFQPFNGAFFDVVARTASFSASTPLLFLLGCCGALVAFSRQSNPFLRSTRYLLVAAAFAPCVTLVWGYIDPRYLADFLPVFVVGSAIALIELWRRWESLAPWVHRTALTAVAVLGGFSILANVGIASTPTAVWSTNQSVHFVEAQKAISDITGHPLASDVVRGSTLPFWAPAGELFVVNDCAGLYVSDGENYKVVPQEQLQHWTWVPVELGPNVVHTVAFTVNVPSLTVGQVIPLVSYGKASVTLVYVGLGYFRFSLADPLLPTVGLNPLTLHGTSFYLDSGKTYSVSVVTDPFRHIIDVYKADGSTPITTGVPTTSGLEDLSTAESNSPLMEGLLTRPGPIVVDASEYPVSNSAAFTIRNRTGGAPTMALCHSLIPTPSAGHH